MNVLAHKKRQNAKSLMKSYINVVAAIIIHSKHVLISKRNDEYLNDFFEFPGGKIKYNETIFSATVREINEELGIKVIPIKKLLTLYHNYPKKRVKLYFILCKLDKISDFDSIKKLKFAKWQCLDKVNEVKLCPADKRAAEILNFFKDISI